MKKTLIKAGISVVGGGVVARYLGNCGLSSRGTAHSVGQFLIFAIATPAIWKYLELVEYVFVQLFRAVGSVMPILEAVFSLVGKVQSAIDISPGASKPKFQPDLNI